MIDTQFDVPDPRSYSPTEPLGPGDAAVMEPLADRLVDSLASRGLSARKVPEYRGDKGGTYFDVRLDDRRLHLSVRFYPRGSAS